MEYSRREHLLKSSCDLRVKSRLKKKQSLQVKLKGVSYKKRNLRKGQKSVSDQVAKAVCKRRFSSKTLCNINIQRDMERNIRKSLFNFSDTTRTRELAAKKMNKNLDLKIEDIPIRGENLSDLSLNLSDCYDTDKTILEILKALEH